MLLAISKFAKEGQDFTVIRFSKLTKARLFGYLSSIFFIAAKVDIFSLATDGYGLSNIRDCAIVSLSGLARLSNKKKLTVTTGLDILTLYQRER